MQVTYKKLEAVSDEDLIKIYNRAVLKHVDPEDILRVIKTLTALRQGIKEHQVDRDDEKLYNLL